ncbi:MAG: dTDP-4-dehydrorhamnose reductase [Gammaproteobacteria bacterium]|nr:dTDP-4-dehydrorhamnose reductase [Gammaproteobacteria bacterium]
MNRILLTGANGQVGWELLRTLSTLGKVVSLERGALNLADSDAIVRAVRDLKPGLIVNPAAYTAVDKAEDEPDLAMAVNGRAPGILAEEAKRIGAALIHYSTDYVFDGAKTTPYTERDATGPMSVYGASKLAGEQAIQAVGAPCLILRTSWVYGQRGKNFLLTMQRLAREREVLSVVDDQLGAPTWCRLLAEATAQIAAQGGAGVAGYLRERGGVYHMSCAGQTSWHGFASAILERMSAPVAQLRPIPSADYPTPAARPAYSVLDNARLIETFNVRLPDWLAGLDMAIG